MIYEFPPPNAPLDQGDIVEGCPILQILTFDPQSPTAGRRKARVQPLYREHLARHFADTFSRIGLPEPYDTVE